MCGKQKFAFVIGDQTISGEGYVRSLTSNMQCDTSYMMEWDNMGCKSLNARPPLTTLDITIDVYTQDMKFSENISSIKTKLVEECSIDELLFVVQNKMQNNKN